MRIPDALPFSVTYIGHDTPSGDVFKGTGFLVKVSAGMSGDRWRTYVVTANHVAESVEGKNFWFKANDADGRAPKIYRGDVYVEGVHWWRHPTDETADVAVHPFEIPEGFQLGAFEPRLFVPSIGTPQSRIVGLGDEVTIVGLFAYVAGTERITPIVRTGTLAMLPTERVRTKRGLMEAHLIEARSISGLSGSPVFVRLTQPLGMFGLDLQGVTHRVYLLGLMHGHWDVDPRDISQPRRRLKEQTEGGINVGIGLVVPAGKILETINQPNLVAMRDRLDREEAELRGGLPTEGGSRES